MRATAYYEFYEQAKSALARAEEAAQAGDRGEARTLCVSALHDFELAIQTRPVSSYQSRTYGVANFIEYFPYYESGLAYECIGDRTRAIELYERELAIGEILRSADSSLDVHERLTRLRELTKPTATPSPTRTPQPPTPRPTRPPPTETVRATPSETPTRVRVPSPTLTPSAIETPTRAAPTPTTTQTTTRSPTPTPSPRSVLEARYDQPATGHFEVHFKAVHEPGIERIELSIDGALLQGWDAPGRPARFSGAGAFDLPEGTHDARLVLLAAGGVQAAQHAARLYSGTSVFPPLFIVLPVSVVSAAGGALLVRRRRRKRALGRNFNPYIAGSPVIGEDMFFGREELLQQVLSTLHNNSLLLFGERRIGKTSLLHSIDRYLTRMRDAEYEFYPVFIDLEGVPEESFFATLMSEVLVQLERKLGTLPVRFEPDQPKASYDSADFVYDLRLIVRRLREGTTKTPKLLLLLDEVDVLNTYSSRTNQRLRSLFMKTFGRHLGLVMAGVGIRKSWDSEGSPWYNFFEQIPVKPFSAKEARDLIRRPVEGVFNYSEDAVNAIVAACECKPYLIQRCCIACIHRVSAEGRFAIGVADVKAILKDVLGGHE